MASAKGHCLMEATTRFLPIADAQTKQLHSIIGITEDL
jgi:hypothetical protein